MIRRITAAETRPIRQRVLRPTQAAEELVYPGDDDATAAHFGWFVGDELVGIASVYEQDEGGNACPGTWRLRGMAVLPEQQGQGIGAALLAASMDYARESGGERYWCNARTTASGFYLGHGMHQVGDVFEVPVIGPHLVMEMALR